MENLHERASLRVLTYNLHRFVGGDGRSDPERVLQVIESVDADILALQEVGWDRSEKQGESAFEWLQTRLAMKGCFAEAFTDERGPYGHALFCRYPLTETKLTDLSVPDREPRIAIEAHLTWHKLPLQVIAVHLGLGNRERHHQMGMVWDRLTHHRVDTQLLMGDFNEWYPWSGTLRRLRAGFGEHPRHPTFPARWPRLALDRIWVRGENSQIRLQTLRDAEARIASDHLPLWGELNRQLR